MVAINKSVISDIRGATKIGFDATVGVAEVVERMHRTIQLRPGAFGKTRPHEPTSGVIGLVYRTVRGSMRLVGKGLESWLAALETVSPAADAGPGREALVAAVNGIHGDYLAHSGNPLAIEMSLRHRGRPIDLLEPEASLHAAGAGSPSGKLLIMVHGLCMNDLKWDREGHDHAALLADELGCTVLYLRYNSGLRVDENGRALAAMLDTLVRHWPCPVDELNIVAHSMGGLLACSACFHAEQQGHDWLQRVRKLVFLGTPHQGSPLERGGQRLAEMLDLSPYVTPFTRLGKARSAGIQDLRHGAITTGGPDFVPLPVGIECFAAAATLAAKRNGLAERLVGDGLVPLDSALGRHKDAAKTLGFSKSHKWVGYEMGHLALSSRKEVYAQLVKWLTSGNWTGAPSTYVQHDLLTPRA